MFNRPSVARAVLQTASLLTVSQSSFVEIYLRRRHALMVEDGIFSHKIDYFAFFLGDSKSRRAYKSHYWFKSYGDFAEWLDFAYWWSFSGGGSAINGATPSS